jgi:hypothetical protein
MLIPSEHIALAFYRKRVPWHRRHRAILYELTAIGALLGAIACVMALLWMASNG